VLKALKVVLLYQSGIIYHNLWESGWNERFGGIVWIFERGFCGLEKQILKIKKSRKSWLC